MATGRYDENGFYTYGEDDLADPGEGFSDLLNRSSDGVKRAVPMLVHNRVVQELNDDATIREATAERFDQEVAGRNLVEGADDRLMKRDVSQKLKIGDGAATFGTRRVSLASTVDVAGAPNVPGVGWGVAVGEREPIWVDPATGDVHLAGMIIRAGAGFHIADSNERVIWSADAASDSRPRRIVPIFLAGQSNADGRGLPLAVELDPADTRVAMWNHASGGLATATVPLSSRATNEKAGLSVATVIAREILAHEPAGTHVVIVNTAVGGTGLVSTIGSGRWLWTDPASLAVSAIPIVRNALEAIARTYPGATIETPRGVWAQGESDRGIDGATYATALKQVLTEMSTGVGFPAMTWVLTGMVPEWIAEDPSPRAAIRAAHVDLPRQMQRTAYADGVPGGGGSYDKADTIHYHRQGVLALGVKAYAATARAALNVPGNPVPPMDVTETPTGITWTPPLCRVTNYVVQASTDGGATWTTVARDAPLETRATIAKPSLVRVATVNETGTSNTTTPLLIGS